jgi:hypothetical protein
LLFKDGSFRWNRLENLLNNAQESQDYDINNVLEQTVDFLFSERGEFIRESLAEEIVKGVDDLGRNALEQAKQNVEGWLGLNGKSQASTKIAMPHEPSNFERVLGIVGLLRETPGFDPAILVPLVPRLFLKPELHQMGQHIASGLAQRAAARLIREVLLREPEQTSGNGRQPEGQPKLSASR